METIASFVLEKGGLMGAFVVAMAVYVVRMQAARMEDAKQTRDAMIAITREIASAMTGTKASVDQMNEALGEFQKTAAELLANQKRQR